MLQARFSLTLLLHRKTTQEELKEAIPYYEQVVEVREATLVCDHAATAGALNQKTPKTVRPGLNPGAYRSRSSVGVCSWRALSCAASLREELAYSAFSRSSISWRLLNNRFGGRGACLPKAYAARSGMAIVLSV